MATIPTLTDASWSDADLDALRVAVLTEQERRARIANAPSQAQQIADQYAQAVKGQPAKAWKTGTVVGPGEKVTEGGQEYRNVSGAWLSASPSQYPMGYQLTTAPTGAAAWKAGEAVKVGDLRTSAGKTYKVLQAHTTQVGWEPQNVAALWALA